jgi:hypothetical protein
MGSWNRRLEFKIVTDDGSDGKVRARLSPRNSVSTSISGGA